MNKSAPNACYLYSQNYCVVTHHSTDSLKCDSDSGVVYGSIDREPEVRATACQELHRVSPYVKSGLLEFVGPCLDPLAIDPVVNVRGTPINLCR
jgi:hypothetical protein